MNTQVSIIIATFGDNKWRELALRRAYPSAAAQGDLEIIVHHDPAGTAASCRNDAVKMAHGEWIIICDADDRLEPGYVDAMLKMTSGDLRYPRVRYITDGTPDYVAEKVEPVVLEKKHLLLGNYMVIGTMQKRSEFLKVGGLSEHESWEDWFCFMQQMYLGAQSVLVPDAVYRIYQRKDSRVTVKDPMKLFLSMRKAFAQWALDYNDGQTRDLAFYSFIQSYLKEEKP